MAHIQAIQQLRFQCFFLLLGLNDESGHFLTMVTSDTQLELLVQKLDPPVVQTLCLQEAANQKEAG